jgi:hypothetical protein
MNFIPQLVPKAIVVCCVLFSSQLEQGVHDLRVKI